MKSNIGVIILTGGFGKRVKRQLGSVPKPLANTFKKPFLCWIIEFLKFQSFCDIIIATHYEHKQFEHFLSKINYNGLNISLAFEESPLGTGGAIINAILKTKKKYDYYLILNGDSILTENFENLWQGFDISKIDGSLFAVYLDNTERFGKVEFDQNQLLKGFVEKKPGKGYINTGVYFFKYRFINKFLNKVQNFSLEKDFFPKIVTEGYKIRTVLSTADFIDIGTPESLLEAESFVKNHLQFSRLKEYK